MNSSLHLTEIVILLAAAVVTVALFRALKLSPVLGYLVAGTLIGPFGFKLIGDVSTSAGFAEFGIIFLLFLIGLELSLARLRSMRKHVFGFGGVQMLATGGLFGIAYLQFGGSIEAAIIIGGGLALSSTAIVLQVLAEQNERSSQVGRLALATLILQDLAVIPLLVFVTVLSTEGSSLGHALMNASTNAVIGMLAIFIVGRLLLRRSFASSLRSTTLNYLPLLLSLSCLVFHGSPTRQVYLLRLVRF